VATTLRERLVSPALLASVFVIATSGLVYQLVAGTLASYVLGDSVAQFSLVIGLYLSAMGVGSWISKYIEGDLLVRFIEIELGLALAGGLSAPILFKIYASYGAFRFALYALVMVIGTLVGLEIPLLLRLLRFSLDLKDLVARVLSFDYIGALVGSILFPALFLPRLGIHQTSIAFGILNALVALTGTFLFPLDRGVALRLRAGCAIVVVALSATALWMTDLVRSAEAFYFGAPIVHVSQSPYQRVVITQSARSTRLFLNGNLQFASEDEYRYHEALVHVPVAALGRVPRRVLVLGGGDGLAARELLRYAEIERIDLVDLDAAVTDLFRDVPLASKLNGGALSDPRVHVINADAFRWLEETPGESWDLAVVDLPDPSNYSVGKLYTDTFYRLLRERVGVRGVAVIQSTSPAFARQTFWSIATTLEEAGFRIAPYHAYVPSFGDWGFILAGGAGLTAPTKLVSPPSGLRFVDDEVLDDLFRFPRDIDRIEAPVSRLNDQKLVPIYTREWAEWGR
jgi:spermidine synthase